MKVEKVDWPSSSEEDTTYGGILISGRTRRILFCASGDTVTVVENPTMEFSSGRRREIKLPVRTVKALMQLASLQARLAPLVKKIEQDR